MNDVPDLRNLLETAQRIQSEMNRVKEALGTKTVQGETGGGLVKCVANGQGELLSLEIDPSIVGDKRMLEDLVVGAVNVALERAKQLAQEELARASGGIPLPPGLFGG